MCEALPNIKTRKEAYAAFIQEGVAARVAARAERFTEERQHLRALPERALPVYRESYARVSRNSVICIGKCSYMVAVAPLRPVTHGTPVRRHRRARAPGAKVAVLERLVGAECERVDYRHIIHSLVRKSGAFRRYAFREALDSTLEFRREYDALVAHDEARAGFEFVRILHLAASDGEQAAEGGSRGIARRGNRAALRGSAREGAGPRTGAGMPDV